RRTQARRRAAATLRRTAAADFNPEQCCHDWPRHLRLGLYLATVPADETSTAVARPAPADPVVHLHRCRPIASDRDLFSARGAADLHESQRLPVQGRIRCGAEPGE